MLRLDVPEFTLADLPEVDTPGLPDSEVLREDCADEEPAASTGDEVKVGDAGPLLNSVYLPVKSRLGISKDSISVQNGSMTA